MKSLWEQFGGVIVVIIAAIALIILTVSMSDDTSEGIQKNYEKFEQVGNGAIDDLVGEEQPTT